MESDSKYIENVLIKLRREYSKDEYVSVLLNQISEKDVEIGKLNSYINELEDSRELSKSEKKDLAKQVRLDELHSENLNLKKRIKKLRENVNDLIMKNL